MTQSILQADPGELAKFFAWFERHTQRPAISFASTLNARALIEGKCIMVREVFGGRFEVRHLGGGK